MTRRIFGMPLCCFWIAFLVAAPLAPSQDQKPKSKSPRWSHAFDLSCRKYGESAFTSKTGRFGVEAVQELNTGHILYIAQTGSLAATANFMAGAIKESKAPEWASGLDLPSRKAGEKDFTKKTRVWALEVFRDLNAGNWIYVTETGNISVLPLKKDSPPLAAELKAPKWLHSADLSCRKGGDGEWSRARKFGIEVYLDNNNNNLVYICETGAIAVIAADDIAPPPRESKAPTWLYGLDLACRKHDEPKFTNQTRKFGVEVFRDENTGNRIYLCESGALSVIPRGKRADDAKVREPKWIEGLDLRCRTVGEKEFTGNTKVYAAEVFRDENNGAVMYMAETGAISTVGGRKDSP